jgi:hypothetical protein
MSTNRRQTVYIEFVDLWIELIFGIVLIFDGSQGFSIGFFADRQKSMILENERLNGALKSALTDLERIKHADADPNSQSKNQY